MSLRTSIIQNLGFKKMQYCGHLVIARNLILIFSALLYYDCRAAVSYLIKTITKTKISWYLKLFQSEFLPCKMLNFKNIIFLSRQWWVHSYLTQRMSAMFKSCHRFTAFLFHLSKCCLFQWYHLRNCNQICHL